jgi:hypothetical protein
MKRIPVGLGAMKETLPINHTKSWNYERSHSIFFLLAVALAVFILIPWIVPGASAAPLPGGTLDPLGIPQYVTPLVIPPVMKNTGTANDYAIAVRQFKQQILPGGIWITLNGRSDTLPPTTVWSYGPAADTRYRFDGQGGDPRSAARLSTIRQEEGRS